MPALDETRIQDILLQRKILTPKALQDAQTMAQSSKISLLDYLISSNLISKTQFGEVVGKFFNSGFVDLAFVQISRQQVLKIPEEIARKYDVVLYAEDKVTAHVATSDPANPKVHSVVQNLFPDKTIGIVYAFSEDIQKAFVHYQPLETRLNALLHAPRSQTEEVVDEIFKEAVKQKASDIHIESHEKACLIRFRVDGLLHTISEVDKEMHLSIVSRIKILARLRIDEHKASQDGAVRLKLDGNTVDLRVSVIPTLDGEKMALRVLSQYIGDLTLSELGFSQDKQKLLIETSQKPFGMILVTGPTSSGKTTTLFALIKLLNKPEVNITTIEDPVEYKIAGVNQIQIDNYKISFASGLRSIVRQDPNIVLLGEIRDTETVEIAVNAALTGHLLLSTFHANDAATAIPRLLDMKVEPFLLASTLQLVIAQRLVRKICPDCKVSETYPKEKLQATLPKLARYFTEESITLHKGTGCKECAGTGYKGREAIYEFIRITPRIQELVLSNPSSKQIWQVASEEGTTPLFTEGMEKVKAGITTIEEVYRVSAPPEESR